MVGCGLTCGLAAAVGITQGANASLATVPFLLVPLGVVMVAMSLTGITLRWGQRARRGLGKRPLSDRPGRGAGAGCLVVFSLVFLLMGGGFLYGFFVRPILRIQAARDWPAVPCTVVSSEVERHSGDDGPTYSIKILYHYEVAGQEYQSDRYHFMGGSSSGYEGKRTVVDRHPPGTRTVCYVNPQDPQEAVLERGYTADLWFGMIPLVFVLVGLAGVVFGIRQWRQPAPPPGASPGLPMAALAVKGTGQAGAHPTPLAGETVELKPRVAPWMKLVGAVLVATFWNGIVSVFLVQVIEGWRNGRGEWFLTLFLVPFVVIGLGLIVAVGYFLLALFNPRVHLRVTPGAVHLGEPLQVEWRFAGRSDRLQRVRVWLEGREEATYRRGTTTSTDRSTFARLDLAEVSARGELRTGTGRTMLPAGTMHSFESDNNKIVWALRVKGEIAFWPDVDEEFAMTVLPARPGVPAEP